MPYDERCAAKSKIESGPQRMNERAKNAPSITHMRDLETDTSTEERHSPTRRKPSPATNGGATKGAEKRVDLVAGCKMYDVRQSMRAMYDSEKINECQKC